MQDEATRQLHLATSQKSGNELTRIGFIIDHHDVQAVQLGWTMDRGEGGKVYGRRPFKGTRIADHLLKAIGIAQNGTGVRNDGLAQHNSFGIRRSSPRDTTLFLNQPLQPCSL